MRYREKLEVWLKSPYIDETVKDELRSVEKMDNEIEDRFYKDLEFGTGGMRGKIGAGTNRINVHTVAKATQGICNYLQETYAGEEISAAIAYDSRHMSQEFAKTTACVFAANNMKVYLFDDLRPTPELSFAVRELKCKAGVVITASHNPPEYNGYKVYDKEGGQVVTKEAEKIIEKINNVDYANIKYSQYEDNQLISIIGSDIDNLYINQIKKLSLCSEIDKDIKIVYTPLHGSGNMPVTKILEEMGYTNVCVVKEQQNPDPDFSTVKSPNPEEESSFELAIKYAKEIDADVIIGTDPDCDRVGLVVKDETGKYIALNGNQTGALLLNYVLSQMKANNTLPNNAAIVKTIVTSEIGREIANKFGVETVDTLTGFKYIAEKIKQFEDKRDKTFVFGYEESYGYLAGTFVRDKDAVIASMLICEMAAYCKKRNISVVDSLYSIYEEYGYYLEKTVSMSFNGLSGQSRMKTIMEYFRENKFKMIAGKNIPIIYDYKMSIGTNLVNGQFERLSYPKSDVLKFCFEDGSWFVLRPSGTEPKLKIYFSVKEKDKAKAENVISKIENEIENIINHIICNNHI